MKIEDISNRVNEIKYTMSNNEPVKSEKLKHGLMKQFIRDIAVDYDGDDIKSIRKKAQLLMVGVLE